MTRRPGAARASARGVFFDGARNAAGTGGPRGGSIKAGNPPSGPSGGRFSSSPFFSKALRAADRCWPPGVAVGPGGGIREAQGSGRGAGAPSDRPLPASAPRSKVVQRSRATSMPRCADRVKALGGSSPARLRLVAQPLYQPSVPRPMNPLLAWPCVDISRRCASTPSSKFTFLRSSTPRP